VPGQAHQGPDLLEKLSQQVPGVIYQFRLFPDGRSCFPYASEAIRSIYEVTPEQVREDASAVFALLHPEDYAGVVASIQESASKLTPWQNEFRVILPMQGVRWRRGDARPERLEDGSILWHGFITDITERKQVSTILQQSEERLRQAVRVSKIGIFEHDHTTDTIYWSTEQRDIYQWSPQEPVSLPAYFKHVHPDDAAAIEIAVKRAHDPAGDGLFDVEHRIIRRDGAVRWVTTKSQTFFEGEGEARHPVRTIGAVLDVTERRHADDLIVRLNKLYATLSETNATIVRVRSEEELFAHITRIAIEFGGLICAWIGLMDEHTNCLVPVYKHGPSAFYADNIRISADPDLPEGRGPGGKALREGRYQVTNDFLTDEHTAPWHSAARAAGIRGSIALPLRREGRVVGLLSLYANEQNFFVDDVVRLLDEMATDISFAMDNIAREERRQLAEKASRESETRLRLAVAASKQGIYDVNLRTGERNYNTEYAVMLGYDPASFSESSHTFFERIHPEDRARWLAAFNGYLRGELPDYHAEFRMRTAGGEWKWISSTGVAVERDDGGAPLRFVGTHTDISERKVAEERMRLSASVFEFSHEAIVITDANLNIIGVNKAFTDTTGYSADEALGRHIRLLKSGYHDQAYYDAIWQQINDTGYWQGELWDRRKNGDIYPNLAAISAVRNEGGAVTHYVDIAADITQHKQAEERIKQLAYYDALTGVPNRVLLQDRAKRDLAQAQRTGTELALFFVDLDRFKNINDSLGHIMGDRLLQAVANRLRETVRDTDTVSRLGGDEFLLLFTVDGVAGAARVARKLLEAIAEPFEIDGHPLRITPSIGISMFPKDGTDFEELLKNADVAMYKAKESGRNAFHFFAPEMNTGALDRLMLESALGNAVGLHQLELYYQPQIRLDDGSVIGVEALVRWHHPVMGLISPGTFIPIAEESGLIVPLGEWVLQEACRQTRYWEETSGAALSISVNLSVRQFALGNIRDIISDVLRKTGLPGERLEVEITESLLVQNDRTTVDTLNDLKAMGVRIAVDDFGTGYSSLSYLKRFPLNRLKIDQSFVRDLTVDRDDQAIASAIINLGHSMGLIVIAEGVEAEAQLRTLRSLGCDEAQGYLFAKPMPAKELEQFLRISKRATSL
jgi:diguanylate cyclase (GGDEF)-like protein/PAS domain S-box-containing protein